MKGKNTHSVVVQDGQAVLELPDIKDGTVVEVQILSSKENHIKKNVFETMGLREELLEAIIDQGYLKPTPVQLEAIPPILSGRDVLATAQTGSGKTAAFCLPILQLLFGSSKTRSKRLPKALILAPTRELAIQISSSLQIYGAYSELKNVTIYGGVSQKPQVDALRNGVDILVATPGRLQDLVNQAEVKLDEIEIFVLDEADRMLDMGFVHDIRRIVKILPNNIQTLLFSATMPPEIEELSQQLLKDPISITVDSPTSTVEKLDSYVLFVDKSNKFNLLLHYLFEQDTEKVLVFSRTRHGANRITKKLIKNNIKAQTIHGDKSQNARQRALLEFREDDVSVLVATDVASRGLDIDDISHVINYDMSNEPEAYIHRIGRTARAGNTGVALNFCDEFEIKYLRRIEQITDEKMQIISDVPFISERVKSLYLENKEGKSRPRSKKPRFSPKTKGKGNFKVPSGKKKRTKDKYKAREA